MTTVENTLLQASTSDRERITTYMSKCLAQFLQNEAAAIDIDMESFEISEAVVSAVPVDEDHSIPWQENPFTVKIFPRKKYSGRVGMYIPRKLQRPYDKRAYLYLKLDGSAGPCTADNDNFIEFAQEYMDKFWKRSKFQTLKAVQTWLWSVWPMGTTHDTCVALVKAYKRQLGYKRNLQAAYKSNQKEQAKKRKRSKKNRFDNW